MTHCSRQRWAEGSSRGKKHQDWSGKYCPHRILSEGRWQSFLQRIETALETLNKPKVVSVKPTTKTPAKPVIKATEVLEEDDILLNETGREEIRALLKKARSNREV